ncbi:MAG: PIN domain-containing protein [bacterium]|nr:PIN domain-containing protein [bacterium]
MDLVLLDTSVLIDFFSSRPSPRADRVRAALAEREGSAIFCCADATLVEFLGGLSTAEERKLRPFTADLTYLQTSRRIAEDAATLRRTLRRRGADIPPSDCLLAAIARHYGAVLSTSDQHFLRIPRLQVEFFA